MRKHYCPYCGKPTEWERFTTSYFFGIMKNTGRNREYRKCLQCREYYFTFTENGNFHGKRIYIKIPKDEAVSWRFKKSVNIQKRMDRIPVTFGESKTWYCRMLNCKFPFHGNPKINRNAELLVNLKAHYKHCHPASLSDMTTPLISSESKKD